jgi:NAD(P)-dependent dehydrogenase (short-subunit alcohol dehydrogenase family)
LILDVTNRGASFEAVNKAQQHFGQIDVLINNAGFGLFGAIEEASEVQARQQFETNVFGSLWITQAVLPIMRKQQSGHIIQVSSILGVATLPVLGLYNASKFAVEGLFDTLATEVKDFGIKVSLIEPNGYETDFGGSSAINSQSIDAYEGVKQALRESATEDMYGKPEATTEAVLKLIDTENPPLRLFLGKVAFPWVKQVYESRLAEWEAWNDVSVAAHGK